MEKARVTPKDFFLWAGAMIAFYWSVTAFVLLIFDYINYAFPNVLAYLPANPFDSGIGGEMASVIVMFAIYIVLMWLIRRDIARDPTRRDVWVRRWALILTLFIAGCTMAGDLITLLAVFFSGNDITLGFLLKCIALLLVAAGVFMHFIADYWGYWQRNPARSRAVGYSAAVVVVLAIIAGFVMFGTPQSARQYRFDQERVQDLQAIQSQVVSYWQAKQTLPAALADLNDPLINFSVPVDPVNGSSYEYQTKGATNFELCATFAKPSRGTENNYPLSPGAGGSELRADSWSHDAGRTCFERTIDPDRYPPIKRPQ